MGFRPVAGTRFAVVDLEELAVVWMDDLESATKSPFW